MPTGQPGPAPAGNRDGLPFAAWYQPAPEQTTLELRVGDLCPKCQAGNLDYDGLLNLACSQCGYNLSGGSGCT